MTRQFDRQEYLPGWMWSLLHILDYHHWHSSKKIRKHRRRKHTICCGYPKTISFQHYEDEAHEYLNADAVPLIDEQKVIHAKKTARNSAKDHTTAVVGREISERSENQQADSYHHLRSSNSLNRVPPEWSNPIIILDKTADATESRTSVDKLVDASLNKNNSDSRSLSREISGVMEIFKINKNMFLEILHDPDVKAARLTKSGSFPLPDKRHLKPSTLEHKSRETWSFQKGEAKLTQSVESKSLEDLLQMPKGAQANDTVVLAVSEESGLSPSPLSRGSNKHGQHHSFMRHFKHMMKKIKHGLGDSKRRSNRTSTDYLLHGVSPRTSLSSQKEDVAIHRDVLGNSINHETSSSSKDLSVSRISHMRRVSSLNESVDRYARLFDNGVDREAKWHEQRSKSLRLTNEDRTLESGYRIKSFRRKLSLQDPDSLYPLPHEPTQLETPFKNVSDFVEASEINKNIEEEGSRYEKNESPADCIAGTNEEISDAEELDEPERQNQDQDFGSTVEHTEASDYSVLESRIEDDVADQTELPDLIGSELDTRNIASVNPQEISSRDCYKENTKIRNHILWTEIEEADYADFEYVKDVLEVSGLIHQGHLGTWHSLDQPLSPTLFKELEVYLHNEVESSSDDTCNHQLLFDSINEVLLQMYASSLAYYPKNFSFGQSVRPLPKGTRIIEEVWKRINWYRAPKSNMVQSLDDIVARDLAKDESWLDLQMDLEDLALDLEEWIFDELLDETVLVM